MIREKFKNYKAICDEIKQLENEIGYAEHQIRKMELYTMQISPVSGNDVKAMTDKLLSLGEEYLSKLELAYSEKLELERYITLLDDNLERVILRYRYIDLMKWDKIARAVGYEHAQLHRIHNRAVAKILSKLGDLHKA